MLESNVFYRIPVPVEVVSNVVKENESHQGPYAGSIDFAVPLSTPVLAAADGIVSRVRDDSNTYGQDISFGQDVNYITIEHEDCELSEYLHLDKDSARVNVGDKVKSGQQIATTGLSGWLFAPHLHFMVYSKDAEPFKCKQIRFSQKLPK